MIASAQVSIYPLRQERLGPAVAAVRTAMTAHGLAPEVGAMSTIVVGEAEAIFAAPSEAFAKAAETGEVVMTVTVSNACPIAR
ncbi:MAG TPA: YkoF family thiamine/hydroxymethylpyrimidine-binding protein [Pseudolabrys sp.]|nr:YkoF family thiamine/hydroxymethylpyrimidine-binding protein [Pseudolabrys sp.]